MSPGRWKKRPTVKVSGLITGPDIEDYHTKILLKFIFLPLKIFKTIQRQTQPHRNANKRAR
jgi:hypothetical protein